MSQVHPQARTKPRTRAEIKAASETLGVLAQRYNVSKATARKWRNREGMRRTVRTGRTSSARR